MTNPVLHLVYFSAIVSKIIFGTTYDIIPSFGTFWNLASFWDPNCYLFLFQPDIVYCVVLFSFIFHINAIIHEAFSALCNLRCFKVESVWLSSIGTQSFIQSFQCWLFHCGSIFFLFYAVCIFLWSMLQRRNTGLRFILFSSCTQILDMYVVLFNRTKRRSR